MKAEFIEVPLVKNEGKKRFEIERNGHFAFIDYKEVGNKMALIHTEAEPELAGTGAAGAVVEKTLHWIDEQKMVLLPYCPFVFSYIKRHPEWKRLVDPKFKGYEKL